MAGRGWRGGGKAGKGGERPPAPKRWQKKPEAVKKPPRVTSRRLKLMLLSLLFVSMLGAFIWAIIDRPPTQVITVAAANYHFPIPPNPWAQQDVDRFKSLDKTIKLADLTPEWEDSTHQEMGLNQLSQRLKDAVRSQRGLGGWVHGRRIVIYMSVYGGVNDNGDPCLIAPWTMSGRLESDGWLKLQDVLDTIKNEVPANTDVLLALDASQLDSLTHLGLVYNSFTEKMMQTIDVSDIPRLTVLNSSSPGEVSWASPELGASIFGYFLFQGIAGAADGEEVGGDGNTKVSMGELVKYVQHEVADWVDDNRRDTQNPMVIWPSNGPGDSLLDEHLVWARGQGLFRAEMNAGGVSDQSKALVDFEDIWTRHEALAAKQPHLSYPILWQRLEQKIEWVEKLELGGYANDAKRELQGLGKYMTDLEGMLAVPNSWMGQTSLVITRQNPSLQKKIDDLEKAIRVTKPDEIAEDENFQEYAPRAAISFKNFTQDQVELAQALSLSESFRGSKQFLETHVLYLLSQYAADQAVKQRARVVRSATLMERAEKAAAVVSAGSYETDPRIHYGVSLLMAKADELRRRSENLLFVGTDAALAEFDMVATSANDAYGEVEVVSQTLVKSLKLRDRVWSELPFLSEWLTARRPAVQKTQEEECDQLINDTVFKIAQGTNALANRLDNALKNPSADPRALLASLNELSTQIEGGMLEVRTVFDQDARDTGKNQVTLRKVAAVLHTPLVRGEARKTLHKFYAELRGQFASDYFENVKKRKVSDTSSRSVQLAGQSTVISDHLKRASRWKSHPAVQLVSSGRDSIPDGPTAITYEGKEDSGALLNAALGHVETTGVLLRQLLKEAQLKGDQSLVVKYRGAIEPFIGRESTPMQVRHVNTTEPGISGLNGADRVVRAAAVFAGYDPNSATIDPTLDLQQLDRHYFSVWYANRCIQDYWGPRRGEQIQDAFFVWATEQHLRAAEGLKIANVSETTFQFGNAEDALRKLRVAKAIVAKSNSILSIDDQETNYKHSLDVSFAEETPDKNGISSLVLKSKGTILPMRGMNDPRDLSAISVSVEQTGEGMVPLIIDPTKLDAPIEFVSVFRGHVSTSSPRLDRPDFKTQVVSGPPKDAQIAVVRDRRKKGALVIILDVSGSMGYPLAGNATEGGATTKWGAAKSAMNQILELLSKTRAFDVGFWMYGHRVGYKNGQPIRADQNDLLPGEDVERIIKVGPFDDTGVEAIKTKINKVEPLGLTPLYLSIRDALTEDFKGIDPSTERHIVILTDGVNDQKNSDIRDKYRIRIGQLEALPKNYRLDIVGLSVSEEFPEEFRRFVKRSGGDVYKPNSEQGLIDSLKTSIGLGDYTVFGPSFNPSRLAKINDSVLLKQIGVHRVEAQHKGQPLDAEVVVEGGENIRILMDGSRLFYEPFSAGTVGFKLVGGVNVRVHVPRRSQDRKDVSFEVSVQRDDPLTFTRRPTEAWIRVTALDSQKNPMRNYHFYDLDIKSDQPVPVIKATAEKWPKDASNASIQVWIKMGERSETKNVITIGDALKDPRLLSQGLDSVSFDVQYKSGRLIIAEQHETSLSTGFPVRVRLIPPRGARPLSMKTHNFYERANAIGHIFQFDPQTLEEQIREFEIEITEHRALADGAVTLPEAVTTDRIK